MAQYRELLPLLRPLVTELRQRLPERPMQNGEAGRYIKPC
jgi:hypothetical protein